MALPIFQRNVVDAQGNILPGAQVTVRDEATGDLVTLFSDREGNTALSNPFFADAQGLAVFYSNPGEYRIDAIGAGGTVTWRYVQVIDTQDITTIGDNIQAIIDAPAAAQAAANSADDAATSAASVNAANIVHVPGTGLPNELDDLAAVKGGNTGALTIGTNDATSLTLETNNTARVTVNSAGNVGIGTSSPVARLQTPGHVVGGPVDSSTPVSATALAGFTGLGSFNNSSDVENIDALYLRKGTADGGSIGISFASGGGNAYLVGARIKHVRSGANSKGHLVFETKDDSSSDTTVERMRIASNGQQSSVIPGGTVLYPEYKCRAWVNFDGTTAPGTIRASGNVSSVIRNGTGDYTVNFTLAMPDANYSANAMGTIGSQTQSASLPNEFTGSASQLNSPTARSVSSFRFFLTTSGGSKANSSSLSLQFFR